jgi:hypothetical protein
MSRRSFTSSLFLDSCRNRELGGARPSCCCLTRCYCLGSQSCAGFADLPILTLSFRPYICSLVVPSRMHPSFGPARGIRSLKPSAAYFWLCALALCFGSVLPLPLLLVDVSKFRRSSFACVHRMAPSVFPFLPERRLRTLMSSSIIEVSRAIALCRTSQRFSLSPHSASHTRQLDAD